MSKSSHSEADDEGDEWLVPISLNEPLTDEAEGVLLIFLTDKTYNFFKQDKTFFYFFRKFGCRP